MEEWNDTTKVSSCLIGQIEIRGLDSILLFSRLRITFFPNRIDNMLLYVIT